MGSSQHVFAVWAVVNVGEVEQRSSVGAFPRKCTDQGGKFLQAVRYCAKDPWPCCTNRGCSPRPHTKEVLTWSFLSRSGTDTGPSTVIKIYDNYWRVSVSSPNSRPLSNLQMRERNVSINFQVKLGCFCIGTKPMSTQTTIIHLPLNQDVHHSCSSSEYPLPIKSCSHGWNTEMCYREERRTKFAISIQPMCKQSISTAGGQLPAPLSDWIILSLAKAQVQLQ